jgi:hypothetical protein
MSDALAPAFPARALVPAFALLVCGAGLWLAARLTAPALDASSIVGWLMLVLLLATAAAVVGSTQRRLAGCGIAYAALCDAAGLLLLLPWLDTHTLTLTRALCVWAVLAGWMAAIFACGVLLRRLPGRAGVVLLAVLAAFWMAWPVAITPAVRASGPAARATLLEMTAYATPGYALIGALYPQIRFSWPQQGLMYRLSPLGQDYPLPLPLWWPFAGGCGLLALVLVGAARVVRERGVE